MYHWDPATGEVRIAQGVSAYFWPVLHQMAEGKNNEAIAGAIFLSVGVVEKHINAIFSKLGLGDEPDLHRRVKAVLIYLSNGARAR